MNEFLFFCIFVVFIGAINCKLDIMTKYSGNEYEDKISNCIENIIEQVKTSEPVVDITAVNFNKAFGTALLHRLKRMRLILRSFLWRENTLPNLFYIIKSRDYDELQHGINQLRQDYFWNPRAKCIIVIENLNGHLTQLSGLLTKFNIYNVSIITSSETDSDIYLFNSKIDNCGKPLGRMLHFFSQCSNLNKSVNLFRFKKIRHTELRGCYLQIRNHNFWPFVSRSNRIGISQFQLGLWSEFTGVNIKMIDHPKDEDFGTVDQKYTATGMLRLLYEHKSNVVIGGYVISYDKAKAFELSYPYNIDHNIVIVPRSEYLRNWQSVFIQFTYYSIAIVFLFLAFFIFAVVRFSIFERNRRDVTRDILIVFGYFCNNVSYKNIKSKSSLRMIVCSMLILVFFLTFLIQAYLLSATTTPIRKYQIRHLDEALSTCKPLRSWYWQMTFDPSHKSALDCRRMVECLPKMKERKNEMLYTVLSEYLYRAVYWRFVDSSGKSEFVVIEEPVMLMMYTVCFRRGSTTVDSFNKLYHISTMSGLMMKHFNDLMYQEKLEHSKIPDSALMPESLHESVEMFAVLFVGYIVATATFVFENRSRIKLFK